MNDAASAILRVAGVSKNFGGVNANRNISFDVPRGAAVGLIGPNGSGKSTLFGIIAGALPLDGGSVLFEGEEITLLSVRDIARRGLIRTFQQTRVYGGMSCVKNMLISAPGAADGARLFARPPRGDAQEADRLLEFVGLHAKRRLLAEDLSFGQQKLLELAMALMRKPKMLLLDEPTAGINPTLINLVIERLVSINRELGVTLLVIEHNMQVVMDLVQTVICLAHGELLAAGTTQQIRGDQRVIDAYLGSG